jgi:aldose 1-epimerase
MKTIALTSASLTLAALLAGCASAAKSPSAASSRTYGTLSDGTVVTAYKLSNANGMTTEILDYGGIMLGLTAPDRNGNLADVMLGFDNLADYESKSPYFGCLVGRYGNRIANGKFTLDGRTCTLATNNDPGGIPCALHGGEKGFDKRMWKASPVSRADAQGVRLTYTSADGEEGYPGNLKVTVHYWLTDANTLRIEYEAYTDKATPINLTQHNYHHLAGEGSGTVNDHLVMIVADKYTPVNAGLIPTGELAPVAGTPFDFTKPTPIGERVNADNVQIKYGGGYDHNWVLNNQDGDMAMAAEVFEPKSGRVMQVWTTEPGLQFYGGNFLDGTLTGKSGKTYEHRSGFCMETQHYPDSPNQPNFPSTILEPGKVYKSATEYRFNSR